MSRVHHDHDRRGFRPEAAARYAARFGPTPERTRTMRLVTIICNRCREEGPADPTELRLVAGSNPDQFEDVHLCRQCRDALAEFLANRGPAPFALAAAGQGR